MPLPFHWLFKRETWNPDAYTAERLARIVSGLVKHGMTHRDVQSAFRRGFGLKIAFPKGIPAPADATLPDFEYQFAKIQSHFARFLKSGMSHRDFCKQEDAEEARREKLLQELEGMRSREESRATAEREFMVNLDRVSQKNAARLPLPINGAARGFYMGQMLNQQQETNEHLRDMLGGG